MFNYVTLLPLLPFQPTSCCYTLAITFNSLCYVLQILLVAWCNIKYSFVNFHKSLFELAPGGENRRGRAAAVTLIVFS